MQIKFDKTYAIIFCICMTIIACTHTDVITPQKEIVYVHVKDTLVEEYYKLRIDSLEKQIAQERNSFNNTKDSLNKELFVANYKLGRVDYYNKVAAKGNNIKYLRGWLNRVLSE